MEAVQILAWSDTHMYKPTRPTVLKTRPISTSRTLIHSYVLQALSLQSLQQGYKTLFPADTREDFLSSSLVAWAQVLSCGYSPTSVHGPPMGIFAQGFPWAHAPTQALGVRCSDAQDVYANLLRQVPFLVPTEAGVNT